MPDDPVTQARAFLASAADEPCCRAIIANLLDHITILEMTVRVSTQAARRVESRVWKTQLERLKALECGALREEGF